jgi:glycosyltransferase involved in cell wall biosynthesis
MEKVLILAYNFPPSTRASANRAKAWAMYMHEFNYYPIIVTRHWDEESQITFEHGRQPCGNELEIKKFDTYEVHYLPYRPLIRDRLFVKHSNKIWFKIFSKIYTYIQFFAIYYSNLFIPYSNIQKHAETILNRDKKITKMVVTVFPVLFFKFAYSLSKKYNLKWIADYRDDWNTSTLMKRSGMKLNNIVLNLERKSEKKWLKSASFITSVSDGYVKKLEIFLNKNNKGFTLENGFFEEEMEAYTDIDLYESFTITYNGSLYPTQQIEIFITAVKKLIKNYPNNSITIRFPGVTNVIETGEKLKQLCVGIEDNVVATDRIAKHEVLTMQAKSHLLLMVGHKDVSDVPSSKIYEYIGLNKKVLICPSDNGVIEETLLDVGLGLIANTSDEAYLILEKEMLRNGKVEKISIDKEKIHQHSRRYQTKILCNLLNKI